MKTKTKTFLLVLLVGWIIAIACTSCSNSIYWEKKKHTATGKHTYFFPGWGGRSTCNTYSTHLPIKESTYKRYHYHRRTTVFAN